MAKLYKIQVDDGKGTEIKPIHVEQGVGDKGSPLHLVAQKSARYELLQARQDGANFAPDQLRVQRKGKNLQIWFDGSKQPDVVIEGYYDDASATPTLMGTAENGNPYEYVPQDPDVNSMPAQLKDDATLVAVALGGPELPASFALAALPLVAAAAGGVGGWAIAGGALALGAVAGGGGGGGDKKVVPSGQTSTLTKDAVNDTGVSHTDGITSNNAPELTVQAEAGAKVVVTVAGKAYVATETSTPGQYKVKLDALPDGVYTPSITVTNSAGPSSPANGSPFTVDTSANNNQPGNVVDPNTAAAVTITTIHDTVNGSVDSGASSTDFVTNDNTFIIKGAVTGFSSTGGGAGDKVLVQIVDSNNVVVDKQYVTPDSAGNWVMDNTAATLADGKYTIKAVVVDIAGNPVNTEATHSLVIDTAGATNPENNPSVDPNANSATVSITGISDDTGTSASDFITADNTLVIQGSTANFSTAGGGAGDMVHVVLTGNGVNVDQYVAADANGNWTLDNTLADGTYSVTATLVDKAGNPLNTGAGGSVTKAVTVVAQGVFAAADVNAIAEDAAQPVAGDVMLGTGDSKAGADSASHVRYADLHISQVKAGWGAYTAVGGAEAVVNGTYGALTLKDNGQYTYELSNSANVQALKEGQKVADVFTYTLTDGAAHTSETTLTIDITGKNDLATFWVGSAQQTTNVSRLIDPSDSTKIENVLTVKDADASENDLLNVGSTPLQFAQAWQVGTFTIAQASQAGDFDWTYDKTASWANGNAIRHDLFTVKSIDGKSSQTFDFEVTPSVSGLTKQEFHTQSTDGIKVMGDASHIDTLVLHGTNSFDLSLANVLLTSVERVDLSDEVAQSVKLSLANLTSADATGGVHRLFVDGTSSDSVLFVGTVVSASQNADHQVAGYAVYQIDSTHDLLVSTAITHGVTFSNS